MKKILMRAVMCVTVGAALAASTTIRAEDFVKVDIPCAQKDASGACIQWGAILKGCKSPCSVEVSYGPEKATANMTRPAGLPINAVIPLK